MITDSAYKILLVIPCYNDVERLKVFLPKLVEFLPTWFSILVSDDGSNAENRRALGALIENLGLDNKERRAELLSPLFTEKNTGKGGAILRGWACSEGCVWGIVERVVRRGRVGKEFSLDAGAGAAGCRYFFSFAKGGEQGVGGAETCVGGGIVGAGGVGGDFVHAG